MASKLLSPPARDNTAVELTATRWRDRSNPAASGAPREAVSKEDLVTRNSGADSNAESAGCLEPKNLPGEGQRNKAAETARITTYVPLNYNLAEQRETSPMYPKRSILRLLITTRIHQFGMCKDSGQ